MATELIKKSEILFEAVSKGSIEDLQKLLKKTKRQERAKIADAFNLKGETPLLVAIRRNDKEMVKFLIKELNADISKAGRFTWKGVDYTEALPLFAAILSDPTCNVYIVNFLAAQDTTFNTVTNICDLASNLLPHTQKIDMMELMGAAYMLNPDSEASTICDHCQLDFTKLDPKCVTHFAAECWSLALHLRDELTAVSSDSSFMKTPSNLSKFSQNVFGSVAEFQTKIELEEMLAQGSRFLLESQALLVSHRILSRIDPDPHLFYLRRLLQFGQNWFSEPNEYNRMVNVVLLALEPFHARQWQDVIYNDLSYQIVLGAVDMIKYIRWVRKEPPPNSSQLPFESLLVVINYVSSLLMKLQKLGDGEKAKYFVAFIADAIEMFTAHGKETSPEFKKWLSGYIKFTNSHPGVFTAFHATCGFPNLPIKIVQLFIEGGSLPNAEDENGNTCLHFLAWNKKSPNFKAAVNLLLGAGAFIDEQFLKLKNKNK